MPDLVVVVPSRGRPEAVAELAEVFQRTCTADTVLLVAVDTDDETLPRYQAPTGMTVFFTWSPAGSGHVGAINWAAARALADFQPFAVAKLDDDHRPRTRGWDSTMLTALREMGTGIVYGNDLLQGGNLPTAPAMTADIVQALGYMGPPILTHLFVDNFWLDLGQRAGCLRYLPNIVIEHMHPLAGKSEWTEGHLRVNQPEAYAADSTAYSAYVSTTLPSDVAKVQALRTVSA
jgi:hypothetical protein